ncbi:MAG TPA: hypothetical protein P5144_15525 [Thermoanaerobaculia bacterium]|nr:hypothetical protein [Thermoanaerobaculia bacterium]HRU10786.1 hypothetical protein [Thermoanaerobaculia bacterium]
MTWRGTGEPVAGWWVEVNVVEGMSYGAALATARDLGGVVAETRRGLPGFDLWRHPAVDRELTVWRSARERTREGKRWAAPAEVVAWLAEVLEWAWARERSAGVVQ